MMRSRRVVALVSAVVGLLGAATPAHGGAGFRLELGPAIAANAPNMKKGTAFAVRALACADPVRAGVIAFSDAVIDGSRRSAIMDLGPTVATGVYAIPFPSWPRGTSGVISLMATCDSARAGAIVPLGPLGFVREVSKTLDRHPTRADIDAALAALTSTANR